MPSLRRTASSPAVRSSPYSYSSSYQSALRTSSNNGGHPNRRSLGSDTSSRRVLADIEWWRVADGQRDFNLIADNESDNRSPDDDQDHVVDSVILSAPPVASLPPALLELGAHEWIPTPALSGTSPEVLRSGFAALSIAPRTPPRRHSRESSISSLESSPEPETSSFSPLEGLRSGMLDLDLHLPPVLPDAVRSRRRERESSNRAVTLPAILMRSHTFADCLSLHDELPSHYADFAVSPLSSAPDFLN